MTDLHEKLVIATKRADRLEAGAAKLREVLEKTLPYIGVLKPTPDDPENEEASAIYMLIRTALAATNAGVKLLEEHKSEVETLKVRLQGAENRARLILGAKDHWMARAICTEAERDSLYQRLIDETHKCDRRSKSVFIAIQQANSLRQRVTELESALDKIAETSEHTIQVAPAMRLRQCASIAAAALAKIHPYMSTACGHGLHDRCRLSCKFCSAPCMCSCHTAKREPGGDEVTGTADDNISQSMVIAIRNHLDETESTMFPVRVSPAFTLQGEGTSVVQNVKDLIQALDAALKLSPLAEVRIKTLANREPGVK